MYELKEWNEHLDLSFFYGECEKLGYLNNHNQKVLVDGLLRERWAKIFILYYNRMPIGSVAAHTLDIDELEPNAVRIAARMCILSHMPGEKKSLTVFANPYNHPIQQFLFPACIKAAGLGTPMYITTNDDTIGNQQKVHNVWAKLALKFGMIDKCKKINYRGHDQSFWKFNDRKFIDELKTRRWKNANTVINLDNLV